MKKIYLSLPKLSSYQYKSIDEQQRLRDRILNWVDWCSKYNFEVNCILEDMLAVELLHDDNRIVWVSTLDENDRRFMLSCVEDYPEEYKTLEYRTCNNKYIEESKKRFKIKTMRDCNGDAIQYNMSRFQTIQNRIQYTSNRIMNKCMYLLQLRNNNNSLKEIEAVSGDGKLIITDDLIWSNLTFYYGGAILNKETVESFIGGIL